jgi:cytochrome c
MLSKTSSLPSSLRLLTSLAALAALTACGGGDAPASTEASAEVTAPAEEPAVDVAAEEAEPVAEVTYASLTGDAAKGEKVFGQCRACHVAEEGVNRVGPSLYSVVGRDAGQIEGFKYSPANKNSGLVWTEEQLFTYLENPQQTIKGTYMAFAGLKKPQDRADVIAYLKAQS